MPEEEEESEGLSARWALILATVGLLLFKTFVPFGRELLYPFTLMATWVHEMGHGLSAIVVGGSFESLDIFWNASGLAHSSGVAPGWRSALVSMGGLLGPPIAGASILALARGPKRATIVLYVLGALMILSVPIWIRSLTGWIIIPGVAAVLAILAYKGGDTFKQVAAQGLGVILGLDTVFGLDYLFQSQVTIDGRDVPSDISNVGTQLGAPWLLCGVILAIISLALVGLGLRVAWMSEVKIPRPKWPKKREA